MEHDCDPGEQCDEVTYCECILILLLELEFGALNCVVSLQYLFVISTLAYFVSLRLLFGSCEP